MQEKFENNLNSPKAVLGSQLATDQQDKLEAIENLGIKKLTDFAKSLGIQWKVSVTY
mgnify:FL=1